MSVDASGSSSKSMEVAIVDVTGDRDKFEHAMTNRIHTQLVADGVPVSPGSPQFVGVAALHAAVPASTTVAVLVAHSGIESEGGVSGSVLEIEGQSHGWGQLAGLGLDLSDMLTIALACEGFTDETIEGICHSSVGGLMLIAPVGSLCPDEAERFVTAFLRRLRNSSPSQLNPDHIRELVDELNPLANNKMRFRSSGVGPKNSVL
jgi:hypothetical protein